MRTNVLAFSLLGALEAKSVSLKDLVSIEINLIEKVNILEINGAGTLSQYLAMFPNYRRIDYPDYDMHNLEPLGEKFDIVIHSDTLEHISNPVHALLQCKDILKSNGLLIYSVPIIVGRMSRDRTGLSKSYHSQQLKPDYQVVTEFGADFWRYPMDAGFTNVRIYTIDYPVAIALAAVA